MVPTSVFLFLLFLSSLPHHASASGGGGVIGAGEQLSLKYVSLALVSIIFFTISYEAFMHRVESSLQGTPYLRIVKQVYKELTVMGLISFIVFMLGEASPSIRANPDIFLAFEFAHVLIFFIAVMLIACAIYLCVVNYLFRLAYLSTDLRTIEDLFTMYHRRGAFKTFWYENWVFPSKLREDFEFKIMHSFFIEVFHVPPSFDFGLYLCESLDNQIVHLVDVDQSSWAFLILVIAINLVRDEISKAIYGPVKHEETAAAGSPVADGSATDESHHKRFLSSAPSTSNSHSVQTFAIFGWFMLFLNVLLMIGVHRSTMKMLGKCGVVGGVRGLRDRLMDIKTKSSRYALVTEVLALRKKLRNDIQVKRQEALVKTKAIAAIKKKARLEMTKATTNIAAKKNWKKVKLNIVKKEEKPTVATVVMELVEINRENTLAVQDLEAGHMDEVSDSELPPPVSVGNDDLDHAPKPLKFLGLDEDIKHENERTHMSMDAFQDMVRGETADSKNKSNGRSEHHHSTGIHHGSTSPGPHQPGRQAQWGREDHVQSAINNARAIVNSIPFPLINSPKITMADEHTILSGPPLSGAQRATSSNIVDEKFPPKGAANAGASSGREKYLAPLPPRGSASKSPSPRVGMGENAPFKSPQTPAGAGDKEPDIISKTEDKDKPQAKAEAASPEIEGGGSGGVGQPAALSEMTQTKRAKRSKTILSKQSNVLSVDLADIYPFGNSNIFSKAIDLLLLLLCSYFALILTNFGVAPLDAESYYLWQFLMVTPACLCVLPLTRVIITTCKLKAVSVLDIEVVARILEDRDNAVVLQKEVVAKFVSQMEEQGLVGREGLKQLFENIDTDGSGFIDAQEFKTMLNSQQIFFSKKMFVHLFRVFDVDNDHLISLKELDDVCFPTSIESKMEKEAKESGETTQITAATVRRRILLHADTHADALRQEEIASELHTYRFGQKKEWMKRDWIDTKP